ncbi:hypothetical protein [Comamonas sp. Tr-654]|uniref:hypothetical protein n=1 Tax=Comamonas sp. Tr-654 TaxID=2608341 RepID=UPI00141F4A64|nr:hypothetical protein [Comamonas sp. Tr-654]
MIRRAKQMQKLLPRGQEVAPWQAKLAIGQSDEAAVGTGVPESGSFNELLLK